MIVAQSCPTLCDPVDYTVHGILQARILEWVAFPFSRGSSQPRDRIQVSCIAGRFFTSWDTKDAQWVRSQEEQKTASLVHMRDRELGLTLPSGVCSYSVAKLYLTLCDLKDCSPPGFSLSMGFPRQEHCRGFHFLLQGIFPTQGLTHISCIGRQVLYCWATREAQWCVSHSFNYPPNSNLHKEEPQ